MIGFELYTFFICVLVFVALTAFFAFMIFYIGKQRVAMINSGVLDEEIIKLEEFYCQRNFLIMYFSQNLLQSGREEKNGKKIFLLYLIFLRLVVIRQEQ